MSIFPDSGHFNVDNIRVCKILVSLENASVLSTWVSYILQKEKNVFTQTLILLQVLNIQDFVPFEESFVTFDIS